MTVVSRQLTDAPARLYHRWICLALDATLIQADAAPHGPSRPHPEEEAAQQRVWSNAVGVAKIVHRWMRDFGSRIWSPVMPVVCMVAASSVLQKLEDSEIADVFHDLWTLMASAAKRWTIVRGFARMLAVHCVDRQLPLQARTKHIMFTASCQGWTMEECRKFVNTIFPNYGDADGREQETSMKDLLERTRDLSLGLEKP